MKSIRNLTTPPNKSLYIEELERPVVAHFGQPTTLMLGEESFKCLFQEPPDRASTQAIGEECLKGL